MCIVYPGRPCLEASEGAAKLTWNNACQHDVDLRARVSDGSTVPKAVWDKNILPDMKAAVAKVMSCYRFTPKEHVKTAQYKDLYENKAAPRLPVPAIDMGELQIMGWDFMVGSPCETCVI